MEFRCIYVFTYLKKIGIQWWQQKHLCCIDVSILNYQNGGYTNNTMLTISIAFISTNTGKMSMPILLMKDPQKKLFREASICVSHLNHQMAAHNQLNRLKECHQIHGVAEYYTLYTYN